MTTTRYFEVKVTGCIECKFQMEGDRCYKICSMDIGKSTQTFEENEYELTPICPMWNETKESETK